MLLWLSFLDEDLQYLLRNIIKRVRKKQALETNTCIMKIKLKGDNLLRASEIDLGFETRGALTAIKPKIPDEKNL